MYKIREKKSGRYFYQFVRVYIGFFPDKTGGYQIYSSSNGRIFKTLEKAKETLNKFDKVIQPERYKKSSEDFEIVRFIPSYTEKL